MKKFTAVLLAVCMLLSVSVMAAEPAQQKVLETVKSRIGSTDEYESFHSSSYTSQGRTMHSFNWENNGETYKSLYITVTESGIVTDYNAYDEAVEFLEGKPTLDRLPIEQVQAAAEAFLQRINPDVAESLVLTPRHTTQSLWSKNYRFDVQRMENGVPVYGDSGSVVVAQDGTTVTGFFMHYTEGLTFDSVSGVISPEEAQKAYAEKLGMQLQYVCRYENGKKTIRPAYYPKVYWGTYIDAKTGEAMKPIDPAVDTFNKEFGSTENTTDSAAGGLSPAEQQEMENIAGLMPITEVEALLRGNKLLDITEDMELESCGLNKQYYGERYLYTLRFRSADVTASASVDAATGQIFIYNCYGNLKGTELNNAVAMAVARNVAGVLAGSYITEFKLNDDAVSYTRYVNGVPFFEDSIHATVDAKSGCLTSFSMSYTEAEFPSVDGVLTPQEAAEKLFAQADYSLHYMTTCSSEDRKTYDRGTLVYVLTEVVGEMDPFTGELHKAETAELPEYTDISGHYGETAITTLRQFGIGFTTEAFKPNAPITQGEFLELLWVVFFGRGGAMLSEGADHTDAHRTALGEGVVTAGEIDLDAPLTRQMSAVLLVRAMGYGPVAEMSEIFRCPFTDVTENVGHISILGAMGVFKGDGQGNFLPQKQLTRADAAIVLYNYLSA